MKHRLRQFHYINNTEAGDIIYDLERTFVIPVPDDYSLHLINQQQYDEPLKDWLLQTGLLTTEDFKLRSEGQQPRIPVLTDLSIDMSGACNMGCTYCFEKDINSRLGKMDEATAMKAVEFFFERNGEAKKVALHFGSGEPLLQFKTLQKIVDRALALSKANQQDISFELTTNATLVTEEIAAFFRQHPFNIRVSFDGPSDIQDLFRPMINNKPSYDKVLRGFHKLMEWIPDRVTVNSVLANGTRLAFLWQWAKEIGIRHFHVIKVGTYVTDDKKLQQEELALFGEDLSAICNDMLKDLETGNRPIDYQPITKIVRRLMIPQPITRFCGVAGTYLGVSSKGKVYPCFRHIGMEQYHLGDIWSGIDNDKRKDFLGKEAADVDTRPVCNTCWARYLCGGGCYADSTVYGPAANMPKTEHCPYWQKEIEVAIQFYSGMAQKNPEYILQLFGDSSEDIFNSMEGIRFLQKQNCS